METTTMLGDSLEKLQAAKNYHRWIFDLCRPYLGRRLLEVGCGLGTMTGHLLACGRVLATDINPQWLNYVRDQWPGPQGAETAVWDVSEQESAAVRAFRPDTIVCVNILEHVADDRRALEYMFRLLPPGGRLVLFVPALSALYGSLDREADHFRRYCKRGLEALAREAGFRQETLHYVNLTGVPGWWLNCRVLKRRVFSTWQISLYDRIVPFIAWWEKRLKPLLGQSLFYVGRKP